MKTVETRDDGGLVIRMHDRAYMGRNGRNRIERAVGWGVSCALLLTIMLVWGVGVPRVQADEGSAPADYGEIPQEFLTNAKFDNDVTTAGSPSMLDYILKHYNLFVKEEATAGHVVGPVVIGGDYHNQANVGQPGVYTHTAPTYVHGTWGRPAAGVTTDEQTLPLYLGTNNFRGVTWADDWGNPISPGVPSKKPVLKDKTDDNTTVILPQLNYQTDRIYFTDEYLDFADVFAGIEEQAKSLVQNAVQHGIVVDVTHEALHQRLEIVDGQEFLVLDAGHEYVLSDDLLNTYANNIILNIEGSDQDVPIEQIARTLICSTSNNPKTPTIDRYRVGNEVKKLQSAEKAAGLSLVFVYPNATNVSVDGGAIFGHIVAPRADVQADVQYNGCVLAKSATMTSEGHMWPYSSDYALQPDVSHGLLSLQMGHKELKGADLTWGRFRFALQEAQESQEQQGQWLPVPDGASFTGLNAQDGSIGFAVSLPPSSSETSLEHDLHYILSEMRGGEENVTYDASRYLVTVRVSVPSGGEPIVMEGYPQYRRLNADGSIDESAGSPDGTFVNVEHKDVTVQPEFEKTVDGQDPTAQQRFVFELTAQNGAPMPNDEQGNERTSMTAVNEGRLIAFDAIAYTSEMLGDDASKEFRYTVRETSVAAGTAGEFVFDSTPRTVVVTLSKDEYGILHAETKYEGAKTFANTTKTAPVGVNLSLTKTVQGDADPETGTLFTFHVRLSDSQGQAFSEEQLQPYASFSPDSAVSVDVGFDDGGAYLIVKLPRDTCWTLESLPQSTRYAIEEVDLPEGYRFVGFSSSADATGGANSKPLQGELVEHAEITATNRFDRADVTVTLPETGGCTMAVPATLGLCVIALTVALFPVVIRRR
ncbi:Spy0128 family protein [Bifidobacterium pseudolongum]|nr:FctA domain-containing protein [Bifidobacterium pseudolongum]